MTGADLRKARTKLGYSLAGLGDVLGVPKNTVARWERGEMEIQHPRMLTLALERLRDLQS